MLASEQSMLTKKENGGQGIERLVIFVQVSREHTENVDFHPGLNSSRSHVDGALVQHKVPVQIAHRFTSDPSQPYLSRFPRITLASRKIIHQLL